MTTLIKLIDTKGNSLHVNPDLVVLVTAPSTGVIGESAVMLFSGMALSIKGGVEEVANKLLGKSVLT